MEEVGARVAPPIFLHHNMPNAYCERTLLAKKRDYLYHQPLSQQYQQGEQLHPPLNDAKNDWNPNSWRWDSSRFMVKPLESENLWPGLQSAENKTKDDSDRLPTVSERNAGMVGKDEDDDRLRLNLGGGLTFVDEPASRPNKKIRSGSPGDNYPVCQVDDCNEDLLNVKDYHRRHKVCEVHSKSAKALVGKQMQRFCQQCSRFHLLSEFDEGKRSCRRRLAGHNRRRRKTQSEDVNSRIPVQGNQDCNTNENLDIVNLLSSLAREQGNAEVNGLSGPDKDQIVHFLSKINSLKLPVDLAMKLQSHKFGNVASSGEAPLKHQERLNADPLTADLLAALSSRLAVPAPDAAVAVLSQSSESSDSARTNKSKGANESVDIILQKAPVVDQSSVGGERSSTSYQSLIEDSDGQVQETWPSLPLKLFSSSSKDDSPPKLASSRKYFSSDSSNPIEEWSPSSSPVAQKLFPMQSLKEVAESERRIVRREVNENDEVRVPGHVKPLNIFGDSGRGSDNAPHGNPSYHAGSISLSGSHNFIAISNADTQNRTGKIMFKLFDKDPSRLPGELRSQIYNWLSNSPLDMESYIRPGCVVLSVYVSMPSASWEQLEANLLERLYVLLQLSNCDFWRSGRFLVYAGRKLASHYNGRIHQFKSCRASLPELISVSPLAVACGQETSLVLRGRNMHNPETKVFCTLMGGYMALEVSRLSSQASNFDEIVVYNFKVHTDSSTDLGRCFIEVENGFKGSSFPVMVADATICKELRLLESELEEDSRLVNEETEHDFGLHGNRRDQVLHFLNELGWLFQRKPAAPMLPTRDFSLGRYKYLLTFAVERDYCALVKKLLDLLLENSLNGNIPLSGSLEALSEFQLLNRAVRRQCRKMVDLLMRFRIDGDGNSSQTYLFPPDDVGPGGITPLHVAASTSGSIDIVDALTSDPQEIGLNGWNSFMDANGLSPLAYAVMSNNHSYNDLVARKLTDKDKGEVSLAIGIEMGQEQGPNSHQGLKVGSCARCAAKSSKYAYRVQASPHGILHHPYMYSLLVIAAVCVCVCLFNRTCPKVGMADPFIWDNLDFGTI